MKLNNCEITVLIKGRPITEYAHRGQFFIEGREGSEYEIRFENRNNFRVEAVLSVDGLSIIDGKEASNSSSGYVVEAYGTITIPGWKVDSATAAHFAFSGKKDSYSTAMTGSARNNGVIGAMVFREKPKPEVNHIHHYYNQPWHNHPSYPGIPKGLMRGMTAGTSNGVAGSGWGDTTFSETSYGTLSASNAIGGAASVNMVGDSVSYSAAVTQQTQTLGTDFGAATQFNTTSVSFERGDMTALMILYYDEIRGLKARGIVVETARKVPSTPQAFPGNSGCPTPPGWER